MNRKSESPQIRAINDMRVKKKLVAWLEDLDDAVLILSTEERVKEGLEDEDIYRLFTLTERMMKIKEFSPIRGRLDNDPDTWRVEDRPVEDIDIQRANKLYSHIEKLKELYGSDNLIGMERILKQMTHQFPEWKDKVNEAEKRSISRIEEVLESEWRDREDSGL
jgi:hypothetical protein